MKATQRLTSASTCVELRAIFQLSCVVYPHLRSCNSRNSNTNRWTPQKKHELNSVTSAEGGGGIARSFIQHNRHRGYGGQGRMTHHRCPRFLGCSRCEVFNDTGVLTGVNHQAFPGCVVRCTFRDVGTVINTLQQSAQKVGKLFHSLHSWLVTQQLTACTTYGQI